jgi:peptidoglycan hydrolase CwlO-like protein
LRAAKAKGKAEYKAFMNEEGYAYYDARNAAKKLAEAAKANEEAKAKANLQEKASSSASSSASSGGPWFPI